MHERKTQFTKEDLKVKSDLNMLQIGLIHFRQLIYIFVHPIFHCVIDGKNEMELYLDFLLQIACNKISMFTTLMSGGQGNSSDQEVHIFILQNDYILRCGFAMVEISSAMFCCRLWRLGEGGIE